MKYPVLFWLLTAVSVIGQGQFYFNNRMPPEVHARFILPTDPADGSISSIGTDYRVELYGGPADARIDQLIPLDPPSTRFRGAAGTALAGYVEPVTPTVPGVGPGERASVMLILSGPFGLPGGSLCFGPYNVTLGGNVIPPPTLPLGTNPLMPPIGGGSICIPEPSIWVLLLIAVLSGGLCLRLMRTGVDRWQRPFPL